MPASSKAKKPNSPESRAASLLAPENAAFASGVFRVAGVDEAGRGPLAGPVIAAAILFPQDILRAPPKSLHTLNDSKKLSESQRERLYETLTHLPGILVGIGRCDAGEIDRINILRATHVAMARALVQIQPLPELALIDGLPVPGLPCPSRNLIGGDALSFSIAAASILAKVTRDHEMRQLDLEYPLYGFARHKGYGTQLHLQALRHYGPCPVHRQSFAPVANAGDLFPEL